MEEKYAVKRQPWMNDRQFELEQQWDAARLQTLRRARAGDEKALSTGSEKALIAVKAQHRLLPDGQPGPEYCERLQMALMLYENLSEAGYMVYVITSGDVHAGCDSVSLAEAGKNWLVDNGVPEECIIQHKHPKSGNDEDWYVAHLMDEDSDYAALHVVCSISQMPRALMTYVTAGWVPTFHPVTYLGLDPEWLQDMLTLANTPKQAPTPLLADKEPTEADLEAWSETVSPQVFLSTEYELVNELGADETLLMDALRPHQSPVYELSCPTGGVAPFFQSTQAAEEANQATRARHEAEIAEEHKQIMWKARPKSCDKRAHAQE